jgi:hypothetical protein
MMENISILNDTRTDNKVLDIITPGNEKKSTRKNHLNQAIATLLAEGGESFFSYVKNLGLSRESELMVLSSNHHYYYDEVDLKNIATLVNLKKLNMIEHLGSFLDTLYRILPPDANFIGCFTDSKNLKKSSILSFYNTAFLNQLINLIDSRTNHYMNRKEVMNLLAANGFKIIDMTEMNGLTFFYAKSNRKTARLSA